MGYQQLSEPKKLNLDTNTLIDNWFAATAGVLIPSWVIGFSYFMASPTFPLVGAMFISIFTIPLVAIASFLLASLFAFLHDIIRTASYTKKKQKYIKQTDFENWIKGCRNGRD